MRNSIFWNDDYSFIVRRLIGMIKDGTRIIYVTGNHDEFMREFTPNAFGHLEIVDEFVHETLDGRKLLIIHGDIFDHWTLKAPWLYHLGDKAHNFSLWANQIYNKIRRLFNQPYWSLSLMLKRNVKKAINHINNFEKLMAKYTKEQGCQGVICGHIHSPAMKEIEDISYYNCGDWVESCTAIIEHHDGSFELRTPDHFVPPATIVFEYSDSIPK